MSFNAEFESRWQNVIKPAIESISVEGERLTAGRVDAGSISDSILTDILDGIGNSRVVFADVSTVSLQEGQPIRNANVLYEVGIAHACRLPEEVVIFRSDSDTLLFDLSNIRVNSYDPENEEAARILVRDSILNSIAETDLRRTATIQKAADSLDAESFEVLWQSFQQPLPTQRTNTLAEGIVFLKKSSAVQRLLDIGALNTSFTRITPENFEKLRGSKMNELLSYEITTLGKELYKETIERVGLTDPRVQRLGKNGDVPQMAPEDLDPPSDKS